MYLIADRALQIHKKLFESFLSERSGLSSRGCGGAHHAKSRPELLLLLLLLGLGRKIVQPTGEGGRKSQDRGHGARNWIERGPPSPRL